MGRTRITLQENMMIRNLFTALLTPFALLLGTGIGTSQAGYQYSINFATNPSLPSAQGMTYATDALQGENTIMSIVGGNRLSVNTFQLASDRGAFYYKDNVYDPNLDLEMETSLKIIDSSFFGISFTAYTIERSSSFVISKNAFTIFGSTMQTGYNFTDKFYKFTYRRTAATNMYEFFIDGVLAVSGQTPSGFNGNQFYFGDGTSTGGNVHAEIQYVKYRNDTFAPDPVPEPTSLAIFAVGGLLSFATRRQLRRNR
jgi:hypothetical protein